MVSILFETLPKNLTNEYDYIVACGLVDNMYFSSHGLLYTISELQRIFSQGENKQKVQFIGNCFKLFTGKNRSPEVRETEKFLMNRVYQQVKKWCFMKIRR